MARFTEANMALAHEIIARYPRPKSALIPLLHLAQEQDGWITDDAMVHIGELVGCSSADARCSTRRDRQSRANRRWPFSHPIPTPSR